MIDDARDRFETVYDFGDPDVQAVPPADPAFEAWLRRAAPSLNAPGTTPVETIWAGIHAAQRSAAAAATDRITGVRPLRRTRWVMPVTIAATLLVGVALDRFVIVQSGLRSASSPTVVARRAEPAPTVDSTARSDLYRLAAVQTLTQAEALLTAYRAGGAGTRNDAAARQLGGWAREVLGSTRLLIDSPAGSDAQLRPLLNDIELVLVQIVRLSGTPLDSTDRALIDRALRDRDLLPRIRTAVPAGAADATIASDD
ncbi:MAG TPA: hypothetical protein VFI52_05295 [Gemmatimonadaceae bacterium]|nr:hypothetical protein [Gemmatimonadaceae bacterium]